MEIRERKGPATCLICSSVPFTRIESDGIEELEWASLRRSVESLFRAIAMAKRLYVGNLKYTVTSEQLSELFEQFGTVSSAQVLSDRDTGRSRGFGFVEMANDDEAQAAIEALDGRDHDGRRLTVNEARPRTSGGGGGGYRGGGGGYRNGGGGYSDEY